MKGTRGSVALVAAGAGLLLCVVVANWAVVHVGSPTGPAGPRVLPVAPGLTAPSGVLLVGAALLLRDTVHDLGGRVAVAAAVACGALLSGAVAPADLAVASALTFAAAETADALVYARLRRNGRTAAVLASNLVGAVVDTALFLTLAFGAASVLDFGAGQVIGKMEATAVLLLAPCAVRAVKERVGRPA